MSVARIERMRVDAPERYRTEIEGARRLAEGRGFSADVDDFGGDVRLTVAGIEDPEEYADLAAKTALPVFALDVHLAGCPQDLVEALDEVFFRRGLKPEFWSA